MNRFLLFFFIAFVVLSNPLLAQRNCATMDVLDRLKAENPDLESRMQAIERQTEAFVQGVRIQPRDRVVVPVVVHIVYYGSRENISDAQVQSQIDVLNADFRALNSDLTFVPGDFTSVIGDAQVEFCLANKDPNGNVTTGITRKAGSRPSWSTSDRVKSSLYGGVDPWDPAHYLNIWVCNIGNGILGYAQFPGGPASTDGVVIDYHYFGKLGGTSYPYNLGRTATHEVGHWLNLRHIWGDATCGDDFVADTPVHNKANYGCPSYPTYSTCGSNIVEMTMNYMDYTDDRCMYMFSAGQAARMQAVFAPGGPRYSIRSSMGCSSSGGTDNGGGGGGTPEVCGIPSGLNTSNITTNSATLNWSAVSNAFSYDVRIRAVGTSSWSSSNTSTTSINATGLSSNTPYEFQVAAKCSSSSSNFTASSTFTTDQEPAPPTECSDVYENNDYRTSAKLIPLNVPIPALIQTPYDQDWYYFNNTSSQPNIQVSVTNLPADYDVRLYRGSYRVGVSDNYGLNDELINYNTNSITTYYVQIYGYRGSYTPNHCYQLKVSLGSNNFRESGEGGGNISLKEIEASPSVLVFPNPASTELTLGVPVVNEDVATQISVFDMTGKLMLHTQEVLSKGNLMTRLDVRNLPNGIYIVRVQNGDFTDNQKFIITH